jgi:hypothetical protein
VDTSLLSVVQPHESSQGPSGAWLSSVAAYPAQFVGERRQLSDAPLCFGDQGVD